uniref:CCHC-type domain-containing protein n=1 Tax=Heliothis virescens TaxID=7102 RepID=A0A2A4J4P6_HELVI
MALSTKFAIKNLCGLDDYSTWKFAIKMILIKEKLFTFTTKYPDSNNSTAIEKDQEALALICLHVEPTLYAITLMNALLDEKLENHSSMHQYVAAVMSLAQKLKDIATGFDDDLVAVVLLRGLPEEYRPMRMALEHSADSALAVSKNKKRNGNNDKNMTKVKCFKCGKKGHKKPDCPEGRIASTTSKSKDFVSLSSFSTGNSFNPLVENGWTVSFDRDGCHFKGKLLAAASEVSGIYKLEGCQVVVDGAALASVQAAAISENPSQLVDSGDKGAEVIWELSRVEGQSGSSPVSAEASQELSSTDEAEVYEDAEVESGETGDSGADNIVVDNVESEETADRGESNEERLISKILDEYGMADCKAVKTPMEIDFHKALAEGEGADVLTKPLGRVAFDRCVRELSLGMCDVL